MLHHTDAQVPRGRRWFAAKTHARKEALAEFHLGRQSITCFYPKIHAAAEKPRRGVRKAPALTPLFPGYVFVHLDIDRDEWYSINGTIGVTKLVQFGARPAPVPLGIVEQMRERTGGDGLLALPSDAQPGDTVRLTGGAFDGWIGKVLRAESRGRVAVLLELMAREMPVIVSGSQVIRVTSPSQSLL